MRVRELIQALNCTPNQDAIVRITGKEAVEIWDIFTVEQSGEAPDDEVLIIVPDEPYIP